MTKISRLEELVALQKARELCREVYRATRTPRVREDLDLERQIRRAAVSTLSNIAEGFERSSPAEFARFLAIARGSRGEVRAQLHVAVDEGYLIPGEFEALNGMAEETGRIIAGLRHSVRPHSETDQRP